MILKRVSINSNFLCTSSLDSYIKTISSTKGMHHGTGYWICSVSTFKIKVKMTSKSLSIGPITSFFFSSSLIPSCDPIKRKTLYSTQVVLGSQNKLLKVCLPNNRHRWLIFIGKKERKLNIDEESYESGNKSPDTSIGHYKLWKFARLPSTFLSIHFLLLRLLSFLSLSFNQSKWRLNETCQI